MEPANLGNCHDWTIVVVRRGSRLGGVLVQGKMRACSVVVGEIGFENAPELSIVHGDDVIQTFPSDGAEVLNV